MKKTNRIIYITFLIIYLEIISKIFITNSLNGLFYTLIFSIPFIFIIYLLTNIFKEKGNKILTFIISFICIFFHGFQYVFYKLFSNIFSFNSIALAGNAIDFIDIAVKETIKCLPVIAIYLIPFILLIIFNKKISFKRITKKRLLLNLLLIFITYGASLLSLQINKNELYSAYNLYYNVNSELKILEEFGVVTYTKVDIKRVIFGFEEKIINLEHSNSTTFEENENNEVDKPITYNKVEIGFESLMNNESNENIKSILTYFKDSNPTNKNEYTGLFKGKNLIFILAEGFNMIAVDKEITPTLYKLTTEGFVFNNFYSPVFLSTTGGEFQATTGMIPTQEILSDWKKYQPTIKYGLGHSFKNIGYEVQAYHNWTYDYYNRDKTMKTLGFDNYMGCRNGLEKLMNCGWLPSDIDLFDVTLPMYKDYDKFATYYVSVSGHSPYVLGITGFDNTKYVKDLPYSNNVKAYLASQIEFDRALEKLINDLDEAGILEDTVISFVGDHYPYTLTMDEINELSDYTRDSIVEVNRSNFVIWNSEMTKPITVDKVGSQIDVLPTLLNLFDIEFDSRLIVGKDILSEEPGVAIFSNRSWVSDYGTYRNGKFTLKEGKTLENESEYINYMNSLVATKFTLSSQIIKYNIYEYIFE
ncbi:MAG: LTA synthase family protein [Firmicutes bacterium]|nr:LTA synthase family protein [Bacillota bacterium]